MLSSTQLHTTAAADQIHKLCSQHSASAIETSKDVGLSYEDKKSYEACGELGHILNTIANKQIVLLSSSMDKAPDPPMNWHTVYSLGSQWKTLFHLQRLFQPIIIPNFKFRETSNPGPKRVNTNISFAVNLANEKKIPQFLFCSKDGIAKPSQRKRVQS